MYGFLVDTSLARSNPAKPENDFASDNASSALIPLEAKQAFIEP